ncbi:MAG: hypothetical protein JO337_00810 [Acidimicrobiales bacterium]|nr:hypothetical protein [Acidimicrobiales bacterium]
MGTFRRHLNVLERTTPSGGAGRRAVRMPLAAPAYRPAPLRAPRSDVRGDVIARPLPVRRVPVSANQAALRRRQAQKRRRDVFFALLAGAVGSFLIAVAGVSVLWPVQGLFDVLLAAYCALLVHKRNLAAERELKLRFMPVDRQAVRPRPAYDLATGYGDLKLRRAAN